MNQETYEYGLNAIEIMDKYHSGDLDKYEADSRLDAIYTHPDNLELQDDNNGYGLSEEEYNLHVKNYINSFQRKLFSMRDNDTYAAEDSLKHTLDITK